MKKKSRDTLHLINVRLIPDPKPCKGSLNPRHTTTGRFTSTRRRRLLYLRVLRFASAPVLATRPPNMPRVQVLSTEQEK